MKRLPFALVALSLSIPAVACLNGAGDEEVASGENDLSQAAKDACNFGFAEVQNAVVNDPANPTAPSLLKITTAQGITPGQKLLWGDFNGDGNVDFAQVKGAEEIQVYKGDGKGAFVKAKSAKKLPNLPNRKRTAIAIVTSGDFDGDGKADVVAIATSKDSAATAEDAPTRGDLTILYGADSDNSLEAPKDIPSLIDPINSYTYYHVAGDLNGDGKDDLAITTMSVQADGSTSSGEIVAFGSADRKLAAAPSGFTSTKVRSFATIAPKTADKPAALIIATPSEIATITFDATNKATVATMDYEFPKKSSGWTGTDLDQNSEKEISILGPDGLTVVPVSAMQSKPSTFEGVPGVLIGSGDFDGNKSSELLYKVDDAKLFAACGAGERANEIVAAPIQVAYGKNLVVAGQLDLNKDGKADLVTLDISDEATRGTVKVYLASGKQDPAPALETFAATGGGTSADAGTGGADATTGQDSGTTTTTDASTGQDSGTTTTTDASTGHDSGTTTTTDASTGHDGGTTTTTDAGTKADGGAVKKDGGATKPDNADDDDSSEGDDDDAPGDDEGTGTKNDAPTKRPTTKPTNGATTGSANVTITPHDKASDDGCSTAPGSHGVSSSAFGGLLAAMMLLVRRRRNRKA